MISIIIKIPEEVDISLAKNSLKVKGPKGEISRLIPNEVGITLKDGKVFVNKLMDTKLAKSLEGTISSHVKNMIVGVTNGWSKILELVGAGFRSEKKDRDLVLSVGFSHPVILIAPEGINFKIDKTLITVKGIDKELVGKISAIIRDVRPPDPYKGKGIKYQDEILKLKPGKQAAKTEGGSQ